MANSSALDYETTPTFNLTVQADDSCWNSTATVTINLNNVDETPPDAPSTPDLVDASDTGSSHTDDITKDDTPTFSGTAEANSLVKLYAGGAQVGSQQLTGGATSWTITSSSLAADGSYDMTATATDAAGNTSAASSALTVLIDTQAPNAPTVTGIADDNGSSDADAKTNDPTLIISGTAEANSTAEVFRDGGSIGTTPANGSGDWTFDYTGTSLSDGSYSFTATAEDAAGNTSAVSTALAVLIDTQAPPTPGGRTPADGTYTNENRPTFRWSEPADPGGSGIRDYHIIVYYSTGSEAKNSYPINTQYRPASLDDDTYTWKLATRDIAGNTGLWSNELRLVVDTKDPIVTVTSPNGGEYWAGGSTKTITWTASDTNFGATPIDLHYTTNGTNWTEIATGEANDGSYSWSPVPNLDLSTVKVRVTATDLAGNSGSDQSDADFTIDSTDPETAGLNLPGTEQSVDPDCTITIPYSATVTDNLCIDAGSVSVVVEFVTGGGTATLNAPAATITNQGGSPNTQVNVSGNFTVSDLTAGDVEVRVRINGADCAGNAATEASDTVTIGDNTNPVIVGLDLPDTDQSVDEFCTITIPSSATVTDNCCIDQGNVSVVVEFVDPFNTATLTAPPALIVNSGIGIPNDTVSVSGSFTVSNLTGDPAQVRVRINGTDCNGNAATQASDTVTIIDSTAPGISGFTVTPTDGLVDDDCEEIVAFVAVVTDNCCIDADNIDVSLSVTNASLKDELIIKTQLTDRSVGITGGVIVHSLTGCPATLTVEINATDCCGNNEVWTEDADVTDDISPGITGLTVSDETVDGCCEATVTFSATVTDNCCVTPGAVTVVVTLPSGNATLGAPTINKVQNGQGRVDVSGSVLVSDLTGCPATVEVTIAATDCCGNSAIQASDTGDVTDTSIPVINDLTVSNENVDGCCEATVTFSATVTDNCCVTPGAVTVDVTLPTANATLGVPVINKVQNGQGQVDVTGSVLVSDLTGCPATVRVTIDAIDCCTNVAVQETSTGDVTDTSIPVINGLTVSDETVDANCEATVTFSATVTDNCCVTPGAVTVDVTLPTANATLGVPVINKVQNGQSQVDVSGSVLVSALSGCPATVEVTIDATDCCGNNAIQVSDTGDVTDTSIPVISDLAVSDETVDANCEATVTFSATVTDNCCVTPGAVTVDVTLPTGNATLGTPVINKVQNGQSQVDVSGSVLVSALSSCPATVEVAIDAVNCCGNGATQASDTGDVNDSTIPVIVWDTGLPDGPEVVSSDTCTITLPIQATVTDNCCILAGNVSVDISVSNATLAHSVTVVQVGDDVLVSGDITVSALTGCPAVLSVEIDATDCCGNDAVQLTDTVEIYDNTNPVINPIASDKTVECDGAGNITELNTWLNSHGGASATDNCCSGVTWTDDFTTLSDDCGETGSATVTFTATDACGNFSTTSATFTIVDTAAPSITTPAGDETVECDGAGNTTELNAWLVNHGGAVASDTCCGTDVTWSNDFTTLSDDCGETDSATVTFTVTACCGLSSTTEATFTIEDTTPPSITTPASDETVECDGAGNTTELNTWLANHGGAVASDTCCGTDVTWTNDFTPLSDDCGETGSATVTFTATDACGNFSTTSATFTIEDTTIPKINDLSFYTDDSYTTPTDEYTVDDCCETTVYFAAKVTDQCCIVRENVIVDVMLPTDNAILENIVVNRVQNGQGQVDITGSADVRCLTSCPARVEVHIEATDCCGNDAVPVTSTATEGRVYDETAPEPKDDRFRLMVRGDDAPFRLDIMQNDDENCSSCTCCGTMWIHDIVNPPEHGTATIEVDHGDCNGGSSIRYAPYPGYCGTDEFTYRIVDACGNVSSTATVFVNLIAETVMDDIYLTTCTNNLISFGIEATDPRINPRNPDEIPFVFSIVTPPMHGVISGDLGNVTYAAHGGIESATITLVYKPAAGFVGRDVLTLRFADPFGGSSTAMVDIAVIKCAGQPGAPPPFVLQQGEIFPLIVPLTFASVYEKEWNTVTLIGEADGTPYQGALSATWEESINRYVLRLDTASLPPGLYRMTIPLGNGETVTLTIEVGEAV